MSAISRLTTDVLAKPAVQGEFDPVGLDVKYGITKSITADLTYNTSSVECRQTFTTGC